MRIVIDTIPHVQQRYPTVGDWFFRRLNDDGTESDLEEGAPILSLLAAGKLAIHIKVSWLPDWKHRAMIAIHEAVEVILCINDGVTQQTVDEFDTQYEKNRPEGDESEPGDACLAPYRNQHCYATAVERMMCAAFGLSWAEYESEIGSLFEAEEKPKCCEGGTCEQTAPVEPQLSQVGGDTAPAAPPAVSP